MLTQDGTLEGGGDVIASAEAVIADPESLIGVASENGKICTLSTLAKT